MTESDVDARIDEVERRLAAEFAEAVGLETVARCVADARAEYSDAKFDAFVPMFVARRAREMLQTLTPQG